MQQRENDDREGGCFTLRTRLKSDEVPFGYSAPSKTQWATPLFSFGPLPACGLGNTVCGLFAGWTTGHFIFGDLAPVERNSAAGFPVDLFRRARGARPAESGTAEQLAIPVVPQIE